MGARTCVHSVEHRGSCGLRCAPRSPCSNLRSSCASARVKGGAVSALHRIRKISVIHEPTTTRTSHRIRPVHRGTRASKRPLDRRGQTSGPVGFPSHLKKKVTHRVHSCVHTRSTPRTILLPVDPPRNHVPRGHISEPETMPVSDSALSMSVSSNPNSRSWSRVAIGRR